MVDGSTARRPPGVVAVLVAADPGPWFDDVLDAFAAQDYPNLSVLVLVAPPAGELAESVDGGAEPTARVAARLPDAYLHRLAHNRGFGAAVGEALDMVEGAAFFLLCHDDCAPAPDAVRLMVEESFRSNAGIVCPKMVRWDDERALLHVGQNADKTGKVVERVQDGEVDAGQHDAVRDIFVAPGGLTLVRADLLRALGGYDSEIPAMGEDLDLSWRAHVAGARVVVAPAAVARHLELVAAGNRPPPDSSAPSLQALQRRHELRAVLTGYSLIHLVRVVPQAFALAVAELVVSLASGDARRARTVVHAWSWNLAHLGSVRRRRQGLRRLRALADSDVRSLHVHGSARLSTYVAGLVHRGPDGPGGPEAAARMPEPDRGGSRRSPISAVRWERSPDGSWRPWGDPDGDAARGSSIGYAFSEDADFDDLDDLGRRGSGPRQWGRPRLFASRRSRFVGWVVVAAVLIAGSRNLIGAPLPLLGQYLPFPAWTSTWHQAFASWQPAGVGSTAPASPAFALLGILGTAVAGRMGFLQDLVVLGCVPVGAWGMSRLIRPFGSPRARFAATIAYLLVPLAYDALATGRWDGLVAYAATPWVLAHLASGAGVAPYAAAGAGLPRWRRSLGGRMIALGALEAACVALAPATSTVVPLCAVGLLVGSVAFPNRRGAIRAAVVAAGATVVAAALLAPWAAVTIGAGRSALSVLGLPGASRSEPGWSGLLRMAVGPVGGSALLWALLASAVAALVLAKDERLAWATRFLVVALGGWLIALVSAKAWALPFAPSLDVLLAPAAAGVAASVGMGVAAFENDLVGHRFGWRQLAAVSAVGALCVGLLPTVAEAANGRWGMAPSGYAGAAGLPAVPASAAGYRVVWLGDPRALPLGGWPIGPGLAYGTSTDGTPRLVDLWPSASAGRPSDVAQAVQVAMRGETVRLGRILATARVRYVVVVGHLAPRAPGGGTSAFPVPAGLVAALSRQQDLKTVPVSIGSLTVFANQDLGKNFGSGRSVSVIARTRPGGPGALDSLWAALMMSSWLVTAAALLGRRRWLDWWWTPLRTRRVPRIDEAEAVFVPTPDPDVPVVAECTGSEAGELLGAGTWASETR